MLLAERAARLEAEAEAANAKADLSSTEALISYLKLEIEKLRRAALRQPLRAQGAAARADGASARRAGSGRDGGRARRRKGCEPDARRYRSFQRKRPSRKPFPEHLPRERIVIPAPERCPCCGSTKLAKLGEDITETLEVIPRQWKVMQTVREKFSCRECETITQPPAPFHVTAARLCRPQSAGHDPVREVRPASAAQPPERTLRPRRHRSEPIDAGRPGRRLCRGPAARFTTLIERHVLAGERCTAMTPPCRFWPRARRSTGRVWIYVRDDRPFGGRAPAGGGVLLRLARSPASIRASSAAISGILQADAYSGYNGLYEPDRRPGPIIEALCWAMRGRKFFELADIAANARRGKSTAAISPIALEAVKRIDAIFDIERDINGLTADERLARPPATTRAARRRPWKPGCASERAKLVAARRCRQGRSITCSSVGTPSPASSTTGESV